MILGAAFTLIRACDHLNRVATDNFASAILYGINVPSVGEIYRFPTRGLEDASSRILSICSPSRLAQRPEEGLSVPAMGAAIRR